MVNERGMGVNHSTIFRWVQQYGSELERRCRPYLCPTNDSWRVDETYIEVKGKQRYLYRAVDSDGNANPLYPPSEEGGQMLLRLALDFLLTAKRDAFIGEAVFP